MYSHLQTDAQGAFLRFITAGENIEWDANNFCSAFALEKDGKDAEFNVYPLYSTAQPTFDPITQAVAEANPVLINGNWTQQWAVVDLPPEQVAANQAAAAAALQAAIIGGAQQRLDNFAKTRNYDGILSLCTYATDTNPRFAAEGQCGVQSRSATWAALYTILAEVTAGTRPVPTGYADIEPDLPELVWPT